MQTIIDLGALSLEPVGIKDRNGVTWLADPELAAADAFWLMELSQHKDALGDSNIIKHLAALVSRCCKPYNPDVTPEALLEVFRGTDLLAILNAFLAHLGLLTSTEPEAPPTETSIPVVTTES